ncbi:MAG: SDR family oxidoreductase [Bacteroidetes bacterium]|nr:SDR family oxidoreductase [Bacteroidota bacterium]
MKKILITGSNGLLGQKLIDLYLKNNDVKLIATARGINRYPTDDGYEYAIMDITSFEQVQEVIKKYKPHCIINTAAMTNVDQCEEDMVGAENLNINAVSHLIDAANQVDAHFIQLSTDFIFDGKAGPYKEDDEPNPLSFYGKTKLEAEKIIRTKSNKWSIIRTILVYGIVHDMSRSNIVLWAKNALEKGQPLKIVDDQFRSPTLAEDLAIGCQLVEQKEAEGIYNISGKDQMSIVSLVERVADYFQLDKTSIERVSSSTLNQPAKRPPITGFNLERSIKELGYNPHSFEEGIELLMRQLTAK